MDYRREIDGLRAIAVLPVILFHAGFQTFSGGFVGVDVFFVISGYLITTIILSELEQGKFSIVQFYERRARRILPALFLMMLVCLPLAWFLLLPGDMKDFSQSVVAVSLFASNILFWRESGYFDTAAELKPLLHTWSLAVEEQYYLIFPIFLMLFWKLGKRWIIVLLILGFIASLGAAQWASHANPEAAFYLLPTRGWELLVGSFAAFYVAQNNGKNFNKLVGELGGWLGLALILYAIFAFDKTTPFPGFYALVPTLGAVLIILFANQQNTIGTLIGNKAFVGIGLLSYSAYLWHQPLFVFARHISLDEPSDMMFLLLSAVTFVLAYLSWRFVETPFRNRQKFTRKFIFSSAFSFTVFFIAIALSWPYYNGYRGRVGSGYDPIVFAQQDNNPRHSECHFASDTFPRPKNYCVLGKGKVTGMLLGDSHADALAHSLSLELSKHNLALSSVTYGACPPVENLYRLDGRPQHKCMEINKQSFEYALSNPDIEYVVLLARWSIYVESYFDNLEGGIEPDNFMTLDAIDENVTKQYHSGDQRKSRVVQQYKKSIERLLEAGKKVVLIYPIPEVGYNVPKRLAKLKALGMDEKVTTSHDVFLERNKQALSVFDSLGEQENLIRVRPDQVLCNSVVAGRCVTEIDRQIMYYDDNHLSNTGSKFIAEKVVRKILQL
jgi:peptidoglycan/LPS O-acetylase OafA/YrhL